MYTMIGSMIEIREGSGFINATRMCTAAGKRVEDWLALEETAAQQENVQLGAAISRDDLLAQVERLCRDGPRLNPV